mmetsp:Transcript_80865/g.143202  ORF Transcript_80865/g.143202 Transcript_80865/m.143202 type:complete len:249 (-) Transcript_80865:3436-4182(-)
MNPSLPLPLPLPLPLTIPAPLPIPLRRAGGTDSASVKPLPFPLTRAGGGLASYAGSSSSSAASSSGSSFSSGASSAGFESSSSSAGASSTGFASSFGDSSTGFASSFGDSSTDSASSCTMESSSHKAEESGGLSVRSTPSNPSQMRATIWDSLVRALSSVSSHRNLNSISATASSRAASPEVLFWRRFVQSSCKSDVRRWSPRMKVSSGDGNLNFPPLLRYSLSARASFVVIDSRTPIVRRQTRSIAL